MGEKDYKQEKIDALRALKEELKQEKKITASRRQVYFNETRKLRAIYAGKRKQEIIL